MIIGVDHGYSMMKTANFAFPTGITRYEHEPYSLRDTLQVNGAYYVCGSGRQSLLREKTGNDSYQLLTLCALAKEIEQRTGGTTADVILAAGLPLTRFGLGKQAFSAYLTDLFRKTKSFGFEDKQFTVNVKDVVLYPQGYAAVMRMIQELRAEPSVIVCDIGSWTVDVMRLDIDIPNAEYCRSIELGMIRCITEISEQVRRNAGLSVTDSQIENILFGRRCTVSGEISRIAIDYGKAYAEKMMGMLLENGFDCKAVPIIFLGGGATFIEKVIQRTAFCDARFITDIHANAKGYEYIARQAFPDE